MAAPAHTFEEAVALLADNPNPMTLAAAEKINIFHDGLLDLAQRLSHIEQAYLEAKFRLDAVEARNVELTKQVEAVKSGYEEYSKHVTIVEQTPNANKDRLDALESRVRAVEGAVGSKTAPKPVKPVSDPVTNPPHPTLAQRMGITA